MALIQGWRNKPTSYGWVSITLHWAMAIAIFGMYPLGLYIDELTYYDAAYRTVPHWHKSIGVLLAITLVIRLGWRLTNPRVQPVAELSTVESWLSHVIHLLLYGLIFIVVISGYLISTADGRSVDVFTWFSVPALPFAATHQEDIAGIIHFFVATLLITIAALHMLAALKHHFINGDSTLRRMLGMK